MAQTQGDYGASGTINKKGYAAKPAVKNLAGTPGVNPRNGRGFGSIGFSANSAVPSLPRAAGGGGGGGMSYGGGPTPSGVGSSRGGQISSFAPTPAPKPPAPPTLEAFSAKDSTYQSQLSALKKALADYMAQQGQAKTQYLTSYGTDKKTLDQNRTQGLDDLGNDFASRGLLQSGLYADSMSDLNGDFDKRAAALEQAKTAFLANQTNDYTNFTSEQQLAQQKALQEAAARRAAQYGG